MNADYRFNTNAGVAAGLALEVAGLAVPQGSDGFSALGAAFFFAGLGFFLWGCWCYSKAKGRSGWFALLGLLSFVGLFALVLLPDSHKASRGRPA